MIKYNSKVIKYVFSKLDTQIVAITIFLVTFGAYMNSLLIIKVKTPSIFLNDHVGSLDYVDNPTYNSRQILSM